MATPIKAGKGLCIRMRRPTTIDPTIKMIGAAGNHHSRTTTFIRNKVEAVSARNSTAEKMMYAKTRSNVPSKSTPSDKPV